MKNSFGESVEAVTGFTLAEVLITLVIIGVIAALTIPSLITRINNAQFVAKLQKEYSVVQQAFNQIVMDSGGSILNNSDFNCSSATCSTSESANAMNAFASKLSVTKNCGNAQGCWYNSSLRLLGGGIDYANAESNWNNSVGKAILADGTSMMVLIYNTSCAQNRGSVGTPLYGSVCGQIDVDVNGPSAPNQMGRDVFIFWITKNGIYPVGIHNDSMDCLTNSTDWTTSHGCAGKVLKEGAMNY